MSPPVLLLGCDLSFPSERLQQRPSRRRGAASGHHPASGQHRLPQEVTGTVWARGGEAWGLQRDGIACTGWGRSLQPSHLRGRGFPWALPEAELRLSAPLTQPSSEQQRGDSGVPSTSSTPAITFLIQEVRQGLGGRGRAAGEGMGLAGGCSWHGGGLEQDKGSERDPVLCCRL